MPSRSICEEAFRKHGISMADLQTKGARPIIELIPKIAEAIKGKLVVPKASFTLNSSGLQMRSKPRPGEPL
jgi:DNA polymerase III epsilon subunit-like protein